MTKKERALLGFIGGTILTAVANKVLDEAADDIGVPHVVAGLIVAVIAHELD